MAGQVKGREKSKQTANSGYRVFLYIYYVNYRTPMKKSLSLQFIWEYRINLHAEGDKLHAEGNKLWAEGDKLWAEGDKLWAEAILSIHGNIKMEWKNYNSEKNDHECHLENGEVYKP